MKLEVRVLIFTRKTFYNMKKGALLFLRGLRRKFEGATASIIEGIASSTEERKHPHESKAAIVIIL